MKNRKVLALFDFDGTITTKDSFLDFSMFLLGKKRLYLLCIRLIPVVAAYFFRIISAKTLKEEFFKRMIKGVPEEKLNASAKEYTEKKLPEILRKSALNAIKMHKENGDDIALVSASAELWLRYFTADHGMKLIATKLVIKDGVFTGEIAGENCRGSEKVRRISETYSIKDFEHIYAYGDSGGDRKMLDIADKKFYRYFK